MNWPCLELELSWGKLAYRDSGELTDSAVVFLHGTGCDSLDYEPVKASWPRGEIKPRFVAVDFCCHGKSDAPGAAFSLQDLADDVTALLNHLEIPNIVLAGHSLGGMVAMPVAHHPVVKGLILFEGWTKLDRLGAFDNGVHMFGHLPDDEVRQIKNRGERYRKRVPEAQWNEFWSTVETFDGSEHLSCLEIPILEVYGTAGRNENAQQLLNVPRRANIEWRWIEGAGHYLPQECPEELAAISAALCSKIFKGKVCPAI